MINAVNVRKSFASKTAIKDLSCTIPKGSIFGIVGCNGAGKSTLMRLLTGIYKPDAGEIKIDEEPVYDNEGPKKKLFFVPDELFLPPQSTIERMANMYSSSYEVFNWKRLKELTGDLELDMTTQISALSKGMKRQAAMALALSCMTEYVLFDETFDGLDPVIRRYFKDVIYLDSSERNVTAVITSHSLRELDDTCDHIAMLHGGRIALSCEVNDMKTDLLKIQIAFKEPCKYLRFDNLKVLHCNICGSIASLIIRGQRREVEETIREREPVLMEFLPISLEEVFIYEMQERGYGIGNYLIKERESYEKATV